MASGADIATVSVSDAVGSWPRGLVLRAGLGLVRPRCQALRSAGLICARKRLIEATDTS